jgi:hypothetical protein
MDTGNEGGVGIPSVFPGWQLEGIIMYIYLAIAMYSFSRHSKKLLNFFLRGRGGKQAPADIENATAD